MPSLTDGNVATDSGYVAALGTRNNTFTVGSGMNLLMVAISAQSVSSTVPGATMTWNGTALTEVANSEQIHSSTWERVAWYFLKNPAVGTYTLATTLTGAGKDGNIVLAIKAYGNHDGSDPVGNFKAQASSTTTINPGSISYTDGDRILDQYVSGINGATLTWSSGAELYDLDYGSMHSGTAEYTASGTGSVTVTTTASASQARHCVSAVRIKPAAAAGTWVATPANPYPGQTVNLALSNYASAPLSANCAFGGVAITLEAGATSSAASFIMPARSAFRFGGGHAAKRFNTNYTLVIANATDTGSGNMQVVPQQPGGFGVRSAVAQSATPDGSTINLGTWSGGAIVLATGDEVWGHVVSGVGAINAPEVNYEVYTAPLVIDWTYYDISAGSWSGLTTTTYSESLTLTSADLSLTPGQTVRLTLTGAFGGAITAAKIVYGAVSIPIPWAVISGTLTDVTIPDLASGAFRAGGSCDQLAWDANCVLRLEAGAEYAETPATIQIVPTTPANWGVIGATPWGVTPVNAQQGDKVYAELLVGTGSFVLSTLTYTPTTPSVYSYHIFNVATARWLDGYISGIAPKWAAMRYAQ